VLLLSKTGPADGKLMLRKLQETRFEATAQVVETEADYPFLLYAGLDVILCDRSLP